MVESGESKAVECFGMQQNVLDHVGKRWKEEKCGGLFQKENGGIYSKYSVVVEG